jgi:hypothetical protein
MRFNRNVILGLLLSALPLFGVGSTMAARLAAPSEEVKGKNNTGCVELLEAKRGAAQCTGDGSLTVRAKVNCVKPADVRICIKTNKGWSCSHHTNKQTGDEISAYECRATGDYVILKRAAGSSGEWQKP